MRTFLRTPSSPGLAFPIRDAECDDELWRWAVRDWYFANSPTWSRRLRFVDRPHNVAPHNTDSWEFRWTVEDFIGGHSKTAEEIYEAGLDYDVLIGISLSGALESSLEWIKEGAATRSETRNRYLIERVKQAIRSFAKHEQLVTRESWEYLRQLQREEAERKEAWARERARRAEQRRQRQLLRQGHAILKELRLASRPGAGLSRLEEFAQAKTSPI